MISEKKLVYFNSVSRVEKNINETVFGLTLHYTKRINTVFS